MGIKSSLSLVFRSKTKKGRTPLLNANNLPGKDPAVGINGFEGVGPEWLLLKRKESLFMFWKKVRFEGGERETDLLVHVHWTNSHFFLVSFLFYSVFFLIFFLFFFLCFFFSLRKITLFFDPPYRAWREPFYSACCDQGFTILPLNCLCLIWAYLPTTRGVYHSLLPDRGRFHFSLYRSISFLPRYKCSLSPLSRHAPNGSPSNLPLLGGLSSQQDVPPKRGLGKSRE